MESPNLLRFARSIVIIPFLTSAAFPFVSVGQDKALETAAMTILDEKRLTRAEMVDVYFRERSMPLAGLGLKFVETAEAHDLDWRLLPAIAVRESSGGKKACGSNPFGWASCRQTFRSYEEAIETVAMNLGGKNPRTARYYDGDTREKLHRYNGTVIRAYPSEVIAIMERIGPYEQ